MLTPVTFCCSPCYGIDIVAPTPAKARVDDRPVEEMPPLATAERQ
jgi:hypothetical protein